MTYPIVIPLHHAGGKLRNNTELRYALRSLDAHFKDVFQVAIVGKRMPDWIQGAEHVPSNHGLKTALKDAAERFPDGFFWWYDDLTLLKDQTGEEMKITPACKGWGRAQTGWSRSLNKIKDRLAKEGYRPWDYSRPHGPYWFDKSMVDEGFRDWPGMKSKFPWESWILSKRDWPRRFGVVRQYYGAFHGAPGDHSVFLNYNDKGNNAQLREWLETRFPGPSRFEKTEDVAEPVETTAKVRFRIKGEEDGPVFQGQRIVKACGGCGSKKQGKRVLFTCHEGCDKRVWEWCGPGIRAFAKHRNAELIELPKCLDANPQWVLFDAFKASLAYGEADEFAWVDSDLVIAYPATDIWGHYPKKLHVCRKTGAYKNNLAGRVGLPDGFPNNCTGVVKWNRQEAAKLAAWYDSNKSRFPRSDGDQELLGAACHETGIAFSWFHPKMHVAGAKPPPNTAFKHKGGPSKIKWIPRFLETNRRHGMSPPELPALKTYRICSPGKALDGEEIIEPVSGETKMKGTSLAHMRAMEAVLKNNVFPCLVLEEDATWMSDRRTLPKTAEDWLFVGLSKYALDAKGKAHKWTAPPAVTDGLINMGGMLATHAIMYNDRSAALRMIECAKLAIESNKPIDVALVQYCQREKVSRKGLASPWLYQSGSNQPLTQFSLNQTPMKPTYDISKYPLFPSEWAQMDDRHIYQLHAAACSDWHGSRVAVEIGSWKGRSTTALIEALNMGKLDHLHIIEIKPQPELHQIIACANDPGKVTLHTVSSWDAKIESADFVFIDGDHKWAAAIDTLRAITWGAKVIAMHDTQAFPRFGDCWGSTLVARLMKDHKEWVWEEDCEDRPDEKTFRGFLVARKKP